MLYKIGVLKNIAKFTVKTTLVRWKGAHQCKISSKLHLNNLNTDLQSMMQNVDKFAARQTRSIVTNTRSSRSHMLYKTGVLKYLAKFTEKHLCWSLFNKDVGLRSSTLLKRHSNTGAFL